ncbi:MAG: ERCC4 domain-containing protein [Verrucomicrobia bacterium]|nr:ERCC4 domain-containing protein [Verrucomicrobiota bacterium]MBU4291214.1 ERCC4 domain-containing protein [Verrucomicrobiota bacterium]MBU4429272.1 ERCC4 domain-containing protein [Verrucomicrobiota bacterium]MCG2678615.1 ERCC4 domain-containing protein [Kiritimatiellia bacterium]
MNPDTQLSTLPALRHLGDLADRHPAIVIDTREQSPLPITRLPIVRAGLYSGDYSVAGLESLFAVERKSIADLVGCCAGSNRERFEHELHRLRGYRFKRLLIIGQRGEVEQKHYRSTITPAAVMGSLAAFEIRYDIPAVWADTPEAGAALVERWAWYFARQQVESLNDLFRKSAISTPMPSGLVNG